MLLGMSLVTYLPRVLPLVLFKNFQLPDLLLKWLGYIPTAILAALLLPSLLIRNGQLNIASHNEYLIAALPAFLVAKTSKSMVWTVLAGMGAVMLLRTIG